MKSCTGPGCGSGPASAQATRLAVSAQADDPEALNTLAGLCQKQFRAWARSKVRASPEDLDDLVGQANVVFMAAVRLWRGPTYSPFLAYLRTAVMNQWFGKGLGLARINGREVLESDLAASQTADGDGDGSPDGALDQMTREGPPSALGEDPVERVQGILRKMPKPAAALLKIVYGIGVDGNGRQREPRSGKALERAHGLPSNTIHVRIRQAQAMFADAAGTTLAA